MSRRPAPRANARPRRPALAVACLALLCLLWPAPWPAAAQDSTQESGAGIVVVDGDTVEVDGRVLRLYGIDAPELGQTCLDKSKRWRCGLQAAVELRSLLAIWGDAACEAVQTVGEGIRAICHDPQFNDPAEVLLARGLATALPDSVPAYRRAELQAKAAKLGIWRGEFVLPSEWRQGRRLPGTADDPSDVCDVKGIVTAKGNRVYYVPTDAGYDAIEVSAERGERTFCSDDEAELAGWKRYPRG